MKKTSWEEEFWESIDDGVPEAPRPITVALVESKVPLVINMGGLLYEEARKEVVVSHQLKKRKEKVIISAPMPHGTIEAEVTYPAQLEVGDKVAVVKLEGGQQILVLAKVAK